MSYPLRASVPIKRRSFLAATALGASAVILGGKRAVATLNTFTLPPRANGGSYYYPNIQTAFPSVNWATLDRLYIPAGNYKFINIGNLPVRSASAPLVITNHGGQVKVGGFDHHYLFVINGGQNWVLTGRYDPVAQTGDAAFPGHAGGNYANSQGTYGITVDDAFVRSNLSGFGIGGGDASDFELDMMEVTRVGFAGMLIKSDNDGTPPMRNVKIHDLYVHDTGSEAIYLGSTQAQPQHTFENLEIYNNRLIRAGTEALQVGQLGGNCHVHHNVIGPGAVAWRSAFQPFQDKNTQWGQRYGSASFHHNIVLGGGGRFLGFFPTTVAGDPWAVGDTVSFHDNYFADVSNAGIYTAAGDTGADLVVQNNTWCGFNFNYDEVYPSTATPAEIFAPADTTSIQHHFIDNTIDGPYPLQATSRPNVTESGTSYSAVSRVQFEDFMVSSLDSDYRQLEWWTATMTRHPSQPPMVYDTGDIVVHKAVLYEALQSTQGQEPDLNPTVWDMLPQPADDVRLTPGSPHQGIGLSS